MRFAVLGTLLSLFLASPGSGAEPPNFHREANPIRGRYIVVLRADIDRGSVEGIAKALASAHRGRTIGIIDQGIKAFGFRGSEQAAIALARNPHVAWVEEDAFGELSTLPPNCTVQNGVTTCTFSSTETPKRWNLDRIDQGQPIGSTMSYSYTANGTGVLAYVIDTGVQASHAEFDGITVETGLNMTVDPDLLDDPQYPDYPATNGEEAPWGTTSNDLDWYAPNNPCGGSFPDLQTQLQAGHGTAVASVLAGRNVGVAPGVTLVPVKVGSCDGKISKLATIRGFAEILKDLQNNRPRQQGNLLAPAVVSSSVRFSAVSDTYDPEGSAYCGGAASGYVACHSAMDSAVYDLVAAGVTVVQAAGNQNRDANNDVIARLGYNSGSYPGALYRVITVGATMFDENDQNRDKTWYCGSGGVPDCWSLNPGSNWGPAVNIWAPAWHVRLALAGGGYRANDASSTGTSFAAPLVAGAVARILQNDPTLTPAQVWAELSYAADRHPTYHDLDPSLSFTNRRLLYIDPSE